MDKIKEFIDYYFNIICFVLFIFLLTGVIVLLYRSFDSKQVNQEEIIAKNIESTTEVKEENSIDKIKVDIKGAVKNPGVYELENTNNVADLINVAGGLKKNADTSNLNLSRKLEDQMVVKVFTKNEISLMNKDVSLISNECISDNVIINSCNENNASIITSTKDNVKSNTQNNSDNSKNYSSDQSNNKIVSINTATKEELMTLNSIGESKANAIIEYRNTNGLFKSIEDIKNVSGIGDALFEKIKSNITI